MHSLQSCTPEPPQRHVDGDERAAAPDAGRAVHQDLHTRHRTRQQTPAQDTSAGAPTRNRSAVKHPPHPPTP